MKCVICNNREAKESRGLCDPCDTVGIMTDKENRTRIEVAGLVFENGKSQDKIDSLKKINAELIVTIHKMADEMNAAKAEEAEENKLKADKADDQGVQGCNNCKYYNHDGSGDGGASTSVCQTCIHGFRGAGMDNWEGSEIVVSCNECKHLGKSHICKECNYCDESQSCVVRWEADVEIVEEPRTDNCSFCKHNSTGKCDECGVKRGFKLASSEWEDNGAVEDKSDTGRSKA